jgi:hypothetical protein
MTEFIAPYTQLGTYSALAILHTLYFTVAHAHTSRILATDLQSSHCHFKSRMKSSFHRLIPFLSFLLDHLRLPSPELNPILDSNNFKRPSLSLYNPSARTTQKTQLSIIDEACLLIPCLAVDVLLLLAYASSGMCLPSRCLAMGLFVTIYYRIYFTAGHGSRAF